MEKMKMESVNLTERYKKQLFELFPNCISEGVNSKGEVCRTVNFEILKQMLANEICDQDEGYEFRWVGKHAAIVEAHKTTRKTLRPQIDKSKNWNKTENIYIEGDNLETLKLLQESYLGLVKMIYIDPPYNTGHDFVYKDNYSTNQDEYEREVGVVNEEGNRLFVNSETNGRFHSDWCSMMYSRLLLARNLLSDDGVIFISIDQHEAASLEKICDEVFGRKNYIANIAVVNNFKGRSDDKYIATAHEQMLIYQKGEFESLGVEIPEEYVQEYKLSDSNGKYRLQGLRKRGSGARREDRPNMYYPFYYNEKLNMLTLSRTSETDVEILPQLSDGTDGRWRWGKETSEQRIDELTVQLVQGRNEYDVFQKDYLPDDGSKRSKPKSFWHKSEFSAEAGTLQVKTLLGKGIFETPKSVDLLKYCIEQSVANGELVMDFFSGSATLAHAVMEMNAQDNGKRRFILVQVPEICDQGSEAYKAGYYNICEIGEERIRRAGTAVREKYNQCDIDDGFRVFTVDESNANDVYYSPAEYSKDLLSFLESNIKSDRTDLDLLFGCLLEWGLPLSMPYSSMEIEGYTVHNYNDGDLLACFDMNIPDSVVKAMAKIRPIRAVFRDSSFAGSPSKINVTEIFKLLAPDTSVKVI